jgi:hypothetical protein
MRCAAVVGAGLGDVDEPIDDGRVVEPIAAPIPALGVWTATAASAV